MRLLPYHYTTRVNRVETHDFFQNQYLNFNSDGRLIDDIDLKNIATHNNIKKSESDIRAGIICETDNNSDKQNTDKQIKHVDQYTQTNNKNTQTKKLRYRLYKKL